MVAVDGISVNIIRRTNALMEIATLFKQKRCLELQIFISYSQFCLNIANSIDHWLQPDNLNIYENVHKFSLMLHKTGI